MAPLSIYYNENDPKMATWLRELIRRGHIASGYVDERSIEDVKPHELGSFTQCHFFAGIAVWSKALRQAGISDDTPLWTGSCPCQPFSSAGARGGFDDERHLWPAFHWLISKCKPELIFGEQTDKKAGEAWLDLVSTDLENEGYAVGSALTAACGFGAPHIRKRIYWVADAQSERSGAGFCDSESTQIRGDEYSHSGSTGNMADAVEQGLERHDRHGNEIDQQGREQAQPAGSTGSSGGVDAELCGPTNGFWRDADWLHCKDGLWRAVRPSTFPLANGVTHKVAKLHGIGNALNAEQAQAFIEAYYEGIAA